MHMGSNDMNRTITLKGADGAQTRPPRRGLAMLLGVMLLVTAGCASTNQNTAVAPDENVNDPFESVNRFVFDVNDTIDQFLIRPIAVAYRDYVPEFTQDMVRSFLRNARSPVTFANQVLQGDFEGAGNVAARFFVNSILGVGGLVDIANYNGQGIPYEAEDFGQTLAVWGIGEGPYLVLPILGPSNPRDALGFLVDTLADPIGIVMSNNDLNEFNYTRTGLTIVDARAQAIDGLDELRASSVDYYAALRSVYRRFREAQIRDGEVPPESIDIPDFDTLDQPAPQTSEAPAVDGLAPTSTTDGDSTVTASPSS